MLLFSVQRNVLLKNLYVCCVHRLEQDVGFGAVCGFQTLAVLTGAIKEQDLQQHTIGAEVPDFYLPRFGDFASVCKDLAVYKTN